ncbi:MAG TPA: hypothetical protein VF487_18305 [Chitinophagaceae bacterium]
MSFSLNALFSLSIGIGAIICWVRYKRTDPAFVPFIWLLSFGLLNEITSISIMHAGHSNAINYNLFALIESLLVTWQFRRWGLFNQQLKLYYFLQLLYPVALGVEWLASPPERVFNSYFFIGHSIIIVLMSISQINRLLFSLSRNMGREPVFLICMGLAIYFTYTVLVEVFWVYGLNQSKVFRLGIYEILSYVNLFTNLLFAFASLWMPLKSQYIMRS